MSNLATLQKHNTDLQNLIERAETLPEKGDFGKQVDGMVDGSITEVSSGATTIVDYAFYQRKSLKTVNIPNATSIGEYAFQLCEKLTSADFPEATSIGSNAFNGCKSLTSANIPKATTISGRAFQLCEKLTSADFPEATSIDTYAFLSCTELTNTNFPKVESIHTNVFNSCTKLTSVDFPNATAISSRAFSTCYKLTTVILRSETLCTLSNANAFEKCYHILGTQSNSYNPNGDKDGYFYVPRALVEDYKVATNWSTFASQFRALEDYTVDGTITGELDPTKI